MRRTRLFDAVERGELTLTELARGMETSVPYLSNIRAGRRRLTRSMEIRAAYFLGIPRDQLYEDESEQHEVRAGSGPSPPPR